MKEIKFILVSIYIFVFCVCANAQIVKVNGNLVTTNTAVVVSSINLQNEGAINNNGEIHLRRNFENNGTASVGNGKFVFESKGAGIEQIISGSSSTEFYDIEVEADTLRVNQEIRIVNQFDFTYGLVKSSSTNLVIFENGSVASGASDTSYVKGPVRKIGNESFTFPLGDSTSYHPCRISSPALLTDHFTAEYIMKNPDNDSFEVDSLDPTLDHVSRVEYWIINRTNGTSDVSVTLDWDTTSAVDMLAEMKVARWDGIRWKDEGGTATGVNEEGSVVSGGSISTFSPFTFASSTNNNPLPVEMLYFNAEEQGEIVYLSWATLTEINNDYFIVQRSPNAINGWVDVFRQDAVGNSVLKMNYDGYDYAPLEGTSYYRIKQVDNDGAFTYSSIDRVNFTETRRDGEISLYPNPTRNNTSLSIENIKNYPNAAVSIHNEVGAELIRKEVNQSVTEINLSNLASGVYTVHLYSNNKPIIVTKLVKTH